MRATCRLTDDWLPLPAATLTALGWIEGDQIELEVVEGALIATRTSATGSAEYSTETKPCLQTDI